MTGIKIKEVKGGIEFGIKAIPNARKSGIEGNYNGMLKVKISAPPDKDRANKELIKILSDLFKVSKSCIAILQGSKAKTKKIRIEKLTEKQVKEVLSERP